MNSKKFILLFKIFILITTIMLVGSCKSEQESTTEPVSKEPCKCDTVPINNDLCEAEPVSNASCETVSNGYYCLEGLNSCTNNVRPKDAYNYPVLPCMNEWKELSGGEEMLEVCQIPSCIAKSMSTQALIQACWEHPSFYQITGVYSSSMSIEIEGILGNFNGYIELLTRCAAGSLLKDFYLGINPVCEGSTLNLNSFELLFSQSVFVSKLTLSEKKQVVVAALDKDNKRRQNWYTSEFTLLLVANIMENACFSPFLTEIANNAVLEYFMHTPRCNGISESLITIITDYAVLFINS